VSEAAADVDVVSVSAASRSVDTLPETAAVMALAFMTVASVGIGAGLVRRAFAGRPLVPPLPGPAAAWDGMTVTLVAATWIGCQYLAMVAASAIGRTPIGAGEEPGVTAERLLSLAAATILAAIVSVVIVLRSGGTTRALGLYSDHPAEDLRLAVGTVLLVTPPLLVVSAVLNWLVPYEHPILDLLAASRDPAALAAVWLSAVVAAPIFEEIFFRGVLQGWFAAVEKRSDPTGTSRLAVVASAACFAAAHYGHGLGWIPLVGFGLAVGTLRAARGSLLPCVLVHAMFNAVSLAIALSQA
jgi:membrane protease YdiL (CAAX protease family)